MTDTATTDRDEGVSVRDELAANYARMSSESDTPKPDAAADEAPAVMADEPASDVDKEKTEEPAGKDDDKAKSAKSDEPAKDEKKTENEPPVDENKDYTKPPPGWSVAAKSAFDELPDEVKSAVAKREQEIDQGFAKLKEYKQLDKDLAPYKDAARQYGVDVPELLKRYDAAEKMLQKNPREGIAWLAKNYGVDLRQFAAPARQEGAKPTGQPGQGSNDPVVQELRREIADLKQQVGRVDTIEQSLNSEKATQVHSSVEKFFSDPKNRYADDVADQMVILIREAKAAGQQPDLNQIYETACYMNPEVRQALIKEQTRAETTARAEKAKQTANQARQAGASITGAPSATQPTGEPDSDNLRATLERNFATLART